MNPLPIGMDVVVFVVVLGTLWEVEWTETAKGRGYENKEYTLQKGEVMKLKSTLCKNVTVWVYLLTLALRFYCIVYDS